MGRESYIGVGLSGLEVTKIGVSRLFSSEIHLVFFPHIWGQYKDDPRLPMLLVSLIVSQVEGHCCLLHCHPPILTRFVTWALWMRRIHTQGLHF